ncbi:MAG: diguanylate cyclase [Anaerolineales bacterium]|nr:diguanylate cyclase [Anaerolineales bacterium]
MEISLLVYLTCLGCLVALTMGISVRAFSRWQSPGARTFGFLMLSMAIWAGCYFIEILHPALTIKILARKFLYLGMSLSPPLWLGFALRYTGISGWWSHRGRVFLLTMPGVIAFFLGLTNEEHQLIWKLLVNTANITGPLYIEYGPAFQFFTFIAYLNIAIGVGVYIENYLHSDKSFRIKTSVMLAGVMITGAINAIFLFAGQGSNIDPTPFSFVVSAPLLALGFFRFGAYSLLPLAAPLVMESLQDAIILANPKDQATDLNQKAKEILGIVSIKEGTSVFDILPQADLFREAWNAPKDNLKLGLIRGGVTRWYSVRIIPLQRSNHEMLGRLIVLHDITSEQLLLKAEQRRSQQLALLEESGRVIADSLNEHDILQRAVDAIIHQFGYALTAISILTPDDALEIVAIGGTEDFGYKPGYRQKLGAGIIGYTALIRKTYVTASVESDPYYFSTGPHFGSAICTPLWKQGRLYGVLYVESLEPNTFDDLDVITLETLAVQISASLDRASLFAQTQENLRTLSIIQDISKAVAGSLELEVIGNIVVQNLKSVFGYSHVSIYLLEDDYLNLLSQVDYPENLIISKIHISQGVIGRTIRTKAAQFIEDTSKEDVFLKADYKLSSEICVPLLKEDVVLGVLNVEARELGQLSQKDVELLTTIAGPIAVAVDNARLHSQLKKMATTDAVTGLFNRYIFEQSLSAEIERAQRHGQQTSLIIFDIDSFKEYNDTWGHPAGDARLKAVATIIMKNLRKYDVAARYGGDEFAVVLSDCSTSQALSFAKRLLEATQLGAPNPPQNGESVPGHTLSMGIATFPKDANTPSELLIAADLAALLAKQQGKNRIKLAGTS